MPFWSPVTHLQQQVVFYSSFQFTVFDFYDLPFTWDFHLVGSSKNRRAYFGLDPSSLLVGSIAFCGQPRHRLHSSALRKSHSWHDYVESAVVECCFGPRGINLTGQIDNAEHQLRVPMRMGVLFSSVVFEGLGFSADAQSARLETYPDLLLVESSNFGACGKLFARFREVELHRRE